MTYATIHPLPGEVLQKFPHASEDTVKSSARQETFRIELKEAISKKINTSRTILPNDIASLLAEQEFLRSVLRQSEPSKPKESQNLRTINRREFITITVDLSEPQELSSIPVQGLVSLDAGTIKQPQADGGVRLRTPMSPSVDSEEARRARAQLIEIFARSCAVECRAQGNKSKDELVAIGSQLRRAIKSRLKLLNRLIQSLLRATETPKFLRDIVLLEVQWFFLHGFHPPRKVAIVMMAPGAVPATI